MIDVTETKERTELIRIAGIAVDADVGGIRIGNVGDFEMIAVRLARAGPAVPPHCRDKAGTCFALCLQAREWGMPIMSVINQSYVVNNHGTDRIAFQSMMIHAVIEKNAKLKGRLRYEIIGAGDERRCKVWGTFKGETKPHEYISETLAALRDARGRNEKGQVKGSPLWETLPEVQMFYSASRQWARLFCPDVILGAYTPDELDADAPVTIDASPQMSELVQRLRDSKMTQSEPGGFDIGKVTTVIEAETDNGDELVTDIIDEIKTNNKPDKPAQSSKTAPRRAANKRRS